MADSLLQYAIQQGDIEQASTLIVETGANVNTRNAVGASPCHIAANNGLISILELILSYGCDPNVTTHLQYGLQTPLHMAVHKGYKKVVETLLNNYADPNIVDSQGFSALHIAARKGYLDIAKLLISKGCNVNAKDNQGKTAYYWAKEYRHDEIAALLPAVKYDCAAFQKELEQKVFVVAVAKTKEKKDKKKGGKKKKKK